jgi:hypothetical protein
MRITFFVFFTVLSAKVLAQQELGDVLLTSHMDLIKSDNSGYFEGVQIGFEGNYFLHKKFAGTAGLEIWSRDGLSGVLGARWYPTPDAFIRARGLIGVDDLSIGGGFAKPIGELIRIEAMTDFYFDGTFSIRAGFAFLVSKK